MRSIILIALLVFFVGCGQQQTEKSSNNEASEQRQIPHQESGYSAHTSHDEDNDDDDNDDNDEGQAQSDDDDDSKVSNGTHTATVEYYNSNTGTRSTYYLDVDVRNGSVESINFPNHGSLMSHHYISGGELDEDGTTTIKTDEEENVEYTVTIDK